MFSSTINNVNLFPHFSFTSCNPNLTHEALNSNEHTTTTTTNNNNSGNIFLYNHHNQIPLTIPFLPASSTYNNGQLVSELPYNTQGPSSYYALNIDQHNTVDFLQERRPVRKDRHSKIYTAQGLRDRRVRLSIEIARKFFDLQDLLGFDRASKTLEWLLTKSKKAIKELASQNGINLSPNNNKQSLSSSNLTSDQIDQDHDVSRRAVTLNSVKNKSSEARLKKLQNASVVVKESRAKARARARERTRFKMSIRKLHDQTKTTCPVSTLFPYSRSDLKIGTCSGIEHETHCSSHAIYQTLKEDLNEEAVGVKRPKSKPYSSIGYQQNLLASYNNNQSQSLSSNWDVTNSISRSNFRAFTNINLGSGPQVQVHYKSWEGHQNN